jgi:hypothetical protein
MISNTEATETALAPQIEQPKATKKATAGKRGAHVAPAKAKPGKKTTPAKKAPKSAKKATGSRDGSKAAAILKLLKQKDGTTLKELMKATGWQAHSVRGFLSGTVGKKMGLVLTSSKGESVVLHSTMDKRASAFFRAGFPFTNLEKTDVKLLEKIILVRNAVAHQSRARVTSSRTRS